ncbi:MAG: hypothetical protein ACJ749_17380 [Flavisolibacter sp.]
MDKRTLVPILLVLSLLSLGYGIYRSTEHRVTTIENGQQVVYGDPQHGLILGLCIFAGFCILGVVFLLIDRPNVRYGNTAGNEQTVVSKKIATNYPQ